MQSSPTPFSRAIRLVATVECAKGVVVLLAASGLLALVHRDAHALAAELVRHAHLNPASGYPKIFVDAAARATDVRLWQLAAGAAMYAALRFVEAYGLYRNRPWAQLLAAASGVLYVPFEIAELVRRPGPLAAAFLLLNVAVVFLMLRALRGRRKAGAA